jgi:hypothetical protein
MTKLRKSLYFGDQALEMGSKFRKQILTHCLTMDERVRRFSELESSKSLEQLLFIDNNHRQVKDSFEYLRWSKVSTLIMDYQRSSGFWVSQLTIQWKR